MTGLEVSFDALEPGSDAVETLEQRVELAVADLTMFHGSILRGAADEFLPRHRELCVVTESAPESLEGT